jgi:hypothetical protein
MPVRKIEGTDIEYYLIVLDENGNERRESDGTLLSKTISKRIKAPESSITDIFLMSHGWMGDIPAAIKQYDAWVAAMAGLKQDLNATGQGQGFKPLIIGLHWPSLPWGDENLPARAGVLGAGSVSIDSEVDAYASRIGDTLAARAAIRTILTDAQTNRDSNALTSKVRKAYQRLFEESGLALDGPGGAPGADRDVFDADEIVKQASNDEGMNASVAAPGLLGFGDAAKDILLAPLRSISFWKMKDRARRIGEDAGHDLLGALMCDAPKARLHLMGHSFGCIVVSASVAGGQTAKPLPRPVTTLYLVQGALSLWSYADNIVYVPGTGGYFRRILDERLVTGPIVTTRSRFDRAVGFFYPLGARARRQVLLGAEDYPEYGGVGAFGIRGVKAEDQRMLPATANYQFKGGRVYNLEASDFISHGGGLSGAHCDIVHPEVAHAFWQATLASPLTFGARPPASQAGKGGLLSVNAEEVKPDNIAMDSMIGGGLLGGLADIPAEYVKPSKAPPPKKPRVTRSGRKSAPPKKTSESKETAERTEQQSRPREQRWINAEIKDHPKGQSLARNVPYTLAFDVDILQRAEAVAGAGFKTDEVFAPGEAEATLTVQLGSQDFAIATQSDSIVLPRVGKSTANASFTVIALHDGPSTITATIHRQGNFVRRMELKFDIGAAGATVVEVTNVGRPLAAAAIIQSREANLTITPSEHGYQCIVCGSKSIYAQLKIQPAELATAVRVARQALMDVVILQNAKHECVFQTQIDIPNDEQQQALKIMARAGAKLFNALFDYPGACDDIKNVGKYLRNMALKAPKLKLQFVANLAPVPWGLLYLGDAAAGAALDWNNFLGMRHIIEMIPMQNNSTEYSSAEIPSNRPQLVVSLNVNEDIDKQTSLDLVERQLAFWKDAAHNKGINYILRHTTTEVVKALASGSADDQLMYFYCHAKAGDLNDPGGTDASCLLLGDRSVILLSDLKLDAPTTAAGALKGAPLVFINACESAEMSPAFYDGFVPYFIDKGARGVIGTECQTPALFAAEWAKRFFELFLNGQPLGEVFLDLRKEFLEKHGNPLGLLYAVHSDGDARVDPPFALAT